MKTVEEILNKYNIQGFGTGQEEIKAAFEEYRNQQPEPQPIDKLFERDECLGVWIKHKNRYILYAYYYSAAQTDFEAWLEIPSGDGLSEQMAKDAYESFIIAEIPKF